MYMYIYSVPTHHIKKLMKTNCKENHISTYPTPIIRKQTSNKVCSASGHSTNKTNL